MPKVKISEYSATANSNTDVASINIDEGCAPSGINNAIRAVMGHLKDFQQGTYGDPFNGPVNGTLGATTASTVAATTLTTSSTVTHNGGTENGVAYLNGLKVLTTGSALVFDGSNLGIGTSSPAYKLETSSSTNNYIGVTCTTDGNAASRFKNNQRDWLVGVLGGASGAFAIYDITSSTQRLTLNANGVLALQGASTSATGVGITFPATQSASSDANTLDDYEEGTWTPGVSFGGGTTGITYTEQNGRYTKIGRQVTVTANVTLSSKGSSTGDATLTGLPFTNTTTRSAGSIYIASVTFADSPSILVEASNTIAYFRETTNAGVATDLTNADFANNSNWAATITYFV